MWMADVSSTWSSADLTVCFDITPVFTHRGEAIHLPPTRSSNVNLYVPPVSTDIDPQNAINHSRALVLSQCTCVSSITLNHHPLAGAATLSEDTMTRSLDGYWTYLFIGLSGMCISRLNCMILLRELQDERKRMQEAHKRLPGWASCIYIIFESPCLFAPLHLWT